MPDGFACPGRLKSSNLTPSFPKRPILLIATTTTATPPWFVSAVCSSPFWWAWPPSWPSSVGESGLPRRPRASARRCAMCSSTGLPRTRRRISVRLSWRPSMLARTGGQVRFYRYQGICHAMIHCTEVWDKSTCRRAIMPWRRG